MGCQLSESRVCETSSLEGDPWLSLKTPQRNNPAAFSSLVLLVLADPLDPSPGKERHWSATLEGAYVGVNSRTSGQDILQHATPLEQLRGIPGYLGLERPA